MTSAVDIPGRNPVLDLSNISTSPTFSFIENLQSPPFVDMTNGMANVNISNKPDCPVNLLPGETLEEAVELSHSKGYLTNYRLIIISSSRNQTVSIEAVAIGNIDQVDFSPNDQLTIACKDARIIRLTGTSNEQTIHWHKKLTALSMPRSAPSLFALTIARNVEGKTNEEWINKSALPEYIFDEEAVFNRWGMDREYFSVVNYNEDYSICNSYPRNLIVPKDMSRIEIESLRDYRMLGRIPAVVWHCSEKNVLLLRASQPRSAFLNWRNSQDEKFLRLVVEYTAKKRGIDNSGKIKIFDCRSYMATLGNRIKGGGSEREADYTNMKLEFCNLPNIHLVRCTFQALRNLFHPPVDQSTYLATLQNTQWLSNIVSILSYSNKAAEQLEKGRNVLIHCSDGWDRTTQLVTLAKILVDPYCRTMAGMEELIRRDWIGYGHKFSDRNGISGQDSNERCPVFLQWLDAVHQIYHKNPTKFEFSMAYLVKLAVHTSSGLFTSFNFNTVQEMEAVLAAEKSPPFPIWRMLNSDVKYENAFYVREEGRERLIAPENIQSMVIWNEVYRCQDVDSVSQQTQEEEGRTTNERCADRSDRESNGAMDRSMVKSKSTESIASASEIYNSQSNQPPLRSESDDEEREARERRGTRTSSTTSASIVVEERGEQRTTTKENTPAATPSTTTTKEMRTTLDCDGLAPFVDAPQEAARKRFAELSAKKEEHERHRMRSEMSDASIGDRRDEEQFQMDDVLSDASYVDDNELDFTPKHVGTQVHATHCNVCRIAFNLMNLTIKINCQSCGKAVCHRCANNTYMETVDGAARPRKACNECYSKMHSTPTPLTPSISSSHHSSSGGERGRGCPDGESATKTPYVSPSQAVKG